MKYCIVGAGGCGGSIGGALARAGKDVTLIARGEHLKKMQECGLKMETIRYGNYEVKQIKAFDAEHYEDRPDVIFVCVKAYSLDEISGFLRKVVTDKTIVIPILNIYGTGEKLQKQFPECLVLDGCIYIAAKIKEPGIIQQNGDIFRIVYGVREKEAFRTELFQITSDLKEAGIDAVLSDNIKRDAFQKYAYVSPMAAAGLFYDAKAADFQRAGEERMLFIKCMEEIDRLAVAMGIPFLVDIVKTNLDIMDALQPDAATSMQRDLQAGKQSEIDGLVFEPVRLGRKYGVETPAYEMIAEKYLKVFQGD